MELEHVEKAQAHLVPGPVRRKVGDAGHVPELLGMDLEEVAVEGLEPREVLMHDLAEGAGPNWQVILCGFKGAHNDERATWACKGCQSFSRSTSKIEAARRAHACEEMDRCLRAVHWQAWLYEGLHMSLRWRHFIDVYKQPENNSHLLSSLIRLATM